MTIPLTQTNTITLQVCTIMPYLLELPNLVRSQKSISAFFLGPESIVTADIQICLEQAYISTMLILAPFHYLLRFGSSDQG